MKYSAEEIGKKIKSERDKLGWSQEGLGITLGKELNKEDSKAYSGKQISKYEKGDLIPPLKVLLALCNIFKCELGYLLCEDDYSSRTKFETSIENELGLNNNSISQLKKITGTDHSCFHFGYHSESFRSILNSFINNDAFLVFMDDLYELNNIICDKTNLDNTLIVKYGESVFNKAIELYNSTTDYLHDPNAPKLENIYYDALNDIDSAIEKQRELSFKYKILRYDLHESFEQLINEVFSFTKIH